MLGLLEPLLGFKPKKSVMIVGNDATGQFLSSFYFTALKAEGQEVPDIIFYPPDTTDFSPFLTRAKSLEPDVVHFWYNGNSTLTALPQALELGVCQELLPVRRRPGHLEGARAFRRRAGSDELRAGVLGRLVQPQLQDLF